MNRKQFLNKQIKELAKDIKRTESATIKKELKAQRQFLLKVQKAQSPKKRKVYKYKSEETRQAAIQRGKQLKASLTTERKVEIERKRIESLEAYRYAQKVAKTDETYKKYWEEVKSLRKQSKKLGFNLSLENITGSPSQIKEAKYSPEEQARFALGLASRIDSEQLMFKAEEAGVINAIYDYKGNIIGYTYDGKGYTVEEMKLMMSSPKTYFKKGSPFWNWIEEEYHANGGGKSGAEAVSSEIFGS